MKTDTQAVYLEDLYAGENLGDTWDDIDLSCKARMLYGLPDRRNQLDHADADNQDGSPRKVARAGSLIPCPCGCAYHLHRSRKNMDRKWIRHRHPRKCRLIKR